MAEFGKDGFATVAAAAAGLAVIVTPQISSWWIAGPLWTVAAVAGWRWWTVAARSAKGSDESDTPQTKSLTVELDETKSGCSYFPFHDSSWRIQVTAYLTLWNADTDQIPIRRITLTLTAAERELGCAFVDFRDPERAKEKLSGWTVAGRDSSSRFVSFYQVVEQPNPLSLSSNDFFRLVIEPVGQPSEIIDIAVDWNLATTQSVPVTRR